ncbi:MAG TPA: glycosyltransferase family 39 protein [Thermoleophilaceae bacterium]|nr:glycosyltransferase family 39 protein [Thermoleophilaceae bacterium]
MLVGLALRLLYAHFLAVGGGRGDDVWYHTMANAIANGHGLRVPRDYLLGQGALTDYSGQSVPTAYHPPLFPALLAIPSKLGLTSYAAHRAVGCAMGAATVAVVGLAGRRLAGDRLGLVAAALAAVYLPAIGNESVLMSESLYGLTIAATILAALWAIERPTARRAAVLGGAIGLAVLTRAEALLLLALLVPFVVRRAPARRLRLAAVAVLATAVVVAPWCVRNTLEFDRLVGVSTGDGGVLAGANNDDAYRGPQAGAWNLGGLRLPPSAGADRFDDAALSARLRRKGLDYAGDHAGRLVPVIAIRVLRTWSAWPLDPDEKVTYNAFVGGRDSGAEWAALLMGWVVMALAVAGAVALRRRGLPLAPLVAPIAMVTVVSALFFGDVRFREAADVSLVLLAAVALTRLPLPGGASDGVAAPRATTLAGGR